MAQYLVTWTIELDDYDADNPVDAAQKSLALVRHHEATFFTVTDRWTGQSWEDIDAVNDEWDGERVVPADLPDEEVAS